MLNTITSDKPCGNDIKYDDLYIEIETEVEKHFNVSNTGETEWEKVIQKSEDLLKSKTKDLKLLSYWLYAQKRIATLDNFLISFDLYAQLLIQYNKELYPKAEKRKIKILEWIENILQEEMLIELEMFTQEQLEHCLKTLTLVEKAISLTLTTPENFFKDLNSKVSDILKTHLLKEEETKKLKILEKEKEEKEAAELLAQEEMRKLRRSEEEETLAKFSSSDIKKTLDDTMRLSSSDIGNCMTHIIQLSTSFLEKAPGDYFSYKLLFSLGEMLIEEALSKKDNLEDMVPSSDIIQVTRDIVDNTISIQQLHALIEQLLIRPTWLEGYYTCSTILYKLGRKEDANKLENMLFHYLYKNKKSLESYNMIPNIMQEWMQKKILSLNANTNSMIEYEQVYQEVLKIKSEQNAQNALLLLEDYYQKSKSQESRFRWKLLFVDFAIEVGDKKIALSLLLELEKLIEIYTLDKWQPDLAIKTYVTFLQPLLSQEVNTELKDRIYNKLSILDVKKVINIH